MPGLSAGDAYVDIVPRLAPGFSSQAAQQIGQGLRPATGQMARDLESAGTTGGAQAGTAAGTNMGRTFGSTAKSIIGSTVGLFAGFGALRFFQGAIGEMREAVRVGNLTNAVIKSTGGEAGVTAAAVGDLANALSLKSGIDDETIQSGENVLLTFTAIRNEAGKGNDVFNRATKVALDMSTALGTDLQGSIIQVGKALNDPIKGVTALQRVGVSFTASQREQIKTLVESGNVLGAQKLILNELGKEFGGAAAAAADPMAKAQVALKNLQETIGVALLPLITEVATVFAKDLAPAITTVVTAFAGLPAPMKTVIVGALGLAILAKPLAGVFKVVGLVGKAFGALASVFKLVASGVRLVGLALMANPWLLVVAAVIAAVVLIILNWGKVSRFLTETWETIKKAAADAWNWVKDFFARFWPIILGIFTGGLGLIVGLIIQNWDAIKRWTVQAFNDVVAFITGVPGMILDALASLGGLLWGLFTSALAAVWNAVSSGFNSVVGFVAGIPGAILGALGDVAGLLFNAGRDTILGFWNGLKSLAEDVLGWVGDFAGDVVDSIGGFLGIGSPSRVFHQLGVDTMRGFQNGLATLEGPIITQVGSFARDVVDAGTPAPFTTTGTAALLAAGGTTAARNTVPARVAATIPASAVGAASDGGSVTLTGPLVEISGPVTIRDERDITDLARKLNREAQRALRASGVRVTAP